MKLGTAHRGGRDRSLGDAERRPVVPGYRVLERLGGDPGTGIEVWKAEGPGGFLAALRVIRLTGDVTPDSLRGLQRLRRARHPNLLAAFGSWRIDGALVLATELPDRSLWDCFVEARAEGAEGIPREELIDHLGEAARGIDYVNGNNAASLGNHPEQADGIPLGEVSPRTILFVGGGIKVADVDSVRHLGEALACGAVTETPFWGLDYAAPERFNGRSSPHSDQYSLALAYCHLRTGRLPFPESRPEAADGPTPRRPVLANLDAAERPALARALADAPERRWPSCHAFINALRADILAADSAPLPAADSTTAVSVAVAAQPRERRLSARVLTVATGAATLAGTVLLAGQPFSTEHQRPVPIPTVQVVTESQVVSSVDVVPSPSPSVESLETPSVQLPDPPATKPSEPTEPPAIPAVPALVQPVAVPAESSVLTTGLPVAPTSLLGVSAGSAALVAWLAATETRPGPATIRSAESGVKPTALADTRAHSANVTPGPPAIRLEAPGALAIEVGGTATVAVTLGYEGGVSGPVEVRLDGLPAGVSALPLVIARRDDDPGSTVSQPREPIRLQVRAEANSPEGETTARLVALAGATRAETTMRVSVRPTPALSARRRGDGLLRREEFAAAVAAYTEALTLDPGDAMALHGRALAAYGKGDFEPALADIDACLRISPGSPTALNNRGLIRLARGEPAAAIADFDTAIRLDPAYAVVRYNRGRAYSETAAVEPALADFDEAVRLDPKFAKAYKARADVLARKGDRVRALADYDEALRLRPDDPAALNNRGLLLFARGDHHRAIADFDEAIRISPRYAVVRYNRGRVYAFLGDTVEALTSFEQAIRLEPTLTRAVQARAELLNRPAAAPASSTPTPSPARTDLGVAARRETAKRTTTNRPPQ